MIGILISYKQFFRLPCPLQPIKLLQNIPKPEVIATISKINSLLNPQSLRSLDDSTETQVLCLKAILLPDQNNIGNVEFKKFEPYRKTLLSFDKKHTLFTRFSCLYAFDKILQTDWDYDPNTSQYAFEERAPIFEFFLACNEEILKLTEGEQEIYSELKINDYDFFEYSGFKMLPHNQYSVNINPLALSYRSYSLIKTILNDAKFSEYLKTYFLNAYNTEDIDSFIKQFLYSYFKSYDENLGLNYFIIPKNDITNINFLKSFSSSYTLKSKNNNPLSVFDFIKLKKSPLYTDFNECVNSDNQLFVVMDTKFFLEKIYGLFINEFWFDYLKIKTNIKRSEWGDFIGKKHFEVFVKEILENSFGKNKEYKLLTFDELKLKYNGKREVEVADIYISKRQKVFIGQVKSNYINMIDGFKTVNSFEDFKNINTDKFYHDFGIYQLANNTISQFHRYKSLLPDSKLNTKRKVHLYPFIIVNEQILSSSVFMVFLRRKFDSILNENGIVKKNSEHIIYPLIILTIEDLQELEQSFSEDSLDLFYLLNVYFDKIKITKKRPHSIINSMTSFSSIIDNKVDYTKLFPERLKDFKWLSND